MADQPQFLWPRARRGRWERFLDGLVRVVELMGRYEIDSPGAVYYQDLYETIDGPSYDQGGTFASMLRSVRVLHTSSRRDERPAR